MTDVLVRKLTGKKLLFSFYFMEIYRVQKTYEDEVSKFLTENKVNVHKGNYKVFKPYEMDL